MANLETLELTIQGNANSAKQGIDNLITSLSSLSPVVKKATADLSALNAQLAKLKSYSGIKLPNLGNTTGAGKIAKGARVPHNIAESFANSQTAESINRMKMSGTVNQLSKELANPNADNFRLASLSERYQKIRDDINGVTKDMNKATNAGKSFGNSVSNAFGKIERMASTMVIRMAIKALIKNFTEAWKSAYNFSKKMGGDFAANIDKVRGALGNMATNIIKAFSPLMNVIAPVISVIATGIEYLTQAITGLLKLLGLASDLIGHSAEQIGSYGDASQKTAKDVTAGFDELNVLDNSKGSGSGSSGSKSTFSAKLQEELDSIKMIVAESMLAVGLLLAFSGHVGVGLAMAAVGAAVIVGTVVEKWGTLSDKVKGEITTIMAIAGSAMLALGAIIAFACPAKLGLGIALMVAGLANTVAAASLSWNLSDDIKQQVGKITGIMGGALLAVGAILALTGAATPLGIGMMVAGGISLASAVALNWDSLKQKVLGAFDGIKKGLIEKWNLIKKAIGDAWDKYMGWTGVSWSQLSVAWNNIKEKLSKVWNGIKEAVVNAWDKVKEWTTVTWDAVMKGDWETVKKQFQNIWNGIGETINNAWTKVRTWITTTWNKFGGWDGIKEKLSTLWTDIKGKVREAWDQYMSWTGVKWSDISVAWNNVKEKLSTVWNVVKTKIGDAWTAFSDWTKTTWEAALQGNWDKVKEQLTGVWDSIWKAVSDAWSKVCEWTGISESTFSDAWNAVSSYFTETLWPGIKSAAEDAWKAICEFWNDPFGKIEKAWKDVSDWFYNNIIKPIKDWWHSIFGGGEESEEGQKTDVDLSEYINLTLDPAFNGRVQGMLTDTMNEILSPDQIDILKQEFPYLDADDIFSVTNFDKLKDSTKDTFLATIIEAFGEDGIKTIKEKVPDISAEKLISIVGMTSLAEDKKKELTKAIETEFGKNSTATTISGGVTGALSSAVAFAKGKLENSGKDVANDVVTGVDSKQDDVKKSGIRMAEKEIEGIDSKKKDLTDSGSRVAGWINEGVSNKNTDTKTTGANVASKIIEGIKSKKDALFETGKTVASDVIDGIKKKKDDIIAAGKTVASNVIDGMKQKEDDIKKAAQSWAKLISEQLSGEQTITVAADSTSVTNMTNGIKTSIENLAPEITVKAKFYSDKDATYPDKLKTDIEALSPTISTKVNFAKDALVNIKNNIEALSPIISADVKVTDVTEFGKQIKKSIVDALKSIKFEVQDDGTLKVEAKAEGGLVRSGDLFLANENGKSEMIGRFGNQSAVANNDQIVAGIANGVAAANTEQNALLRRQNEILLGILKKEGNVRLGASSALGRTVRQSLDMYSMATGV